MSNNITDLSNDALVEHLLSKTDPTPILFLRALMSTIVFYQLYIRFSSDVIIASLVWHFTFLLGQLTALPLGELLTAFSLTCFMIDEFEEFLEIVRNKVSAHVISSLVTDVQQDNAMMWLNISVSIVRICMWICFWNTTNTVTNIIYPR
jgi:hypothetical protein